MSLSHLVPRTLHTSRRPSRTAQWTTFGRALEQRRPPDERIVGDPFASVFLAAAYRGALAPLAAAGPVRHRIERAGLASIATSALCRHAFIDSHLLETLPEVEQVVVLGAGYDSRAYRFAEQIGGRPVFEVDLPPLSRAKAAIVDAHPEQFGNGGVARVEIDFRTQSLPTRLAGSGLRLAAPTFVIWEGVSMYLDREAVVSTLAALRDVCGRESVLCMDLWQHTGAHAVTTRLRRTAVGAMRLIGEPITFAVASSQVSRVLEAAGFDVMDLAVASSLATRFATGGRTCDDGLYVVAAGLH